MPGTILLDDAQKLYTDRLQQHAQDAYAALQQANQPPFQNVQVQPPSVSLPQPPQIDPNEIIQRLQQHAQDAFQAVQQANQPPFQNVQIDPNDITARLQQHAQDAFQAVDQNVQPLVQGLQQANQPPFAQPAQPIAQGVQTAAPAAPAGETVAPEHAPSPPQQTDGTQIANTPNASGQIFPLGIKPDNAPTATYHSQGGSDLMAPRGTPVLNMQNGRVEEVFTDNGSHTVGGNAVLVHGDDGLDYYYAHFDQPTALKVGQRVSTGEQIGAVGNSGNAYKDGQGATHLHIGIGHGISNGVGSEGGLGENFNAQALLTNLQSGIGQAATAARGAVQTTAAAALAKVGQGQQDFVNSLQSLAQDTANRTGIDPNAMLAIAANETGWGRSQTAQQQNNLFSIQGDGSNGSRWASYGSPGQAFDAFTNLIRSAPRYAQAWADRADPGKFIDDLRQAGYVVDEPGFPAQGWVDQVKSIYSRLPPTSDASGPSPQRTAAAGGADSTTNGPLEQAGQVVQQGGRAITSGLQQAQGVVSGAANAVQGAATELATRAGQTAQDVRQAVQNQATLPPALGGARVGDVTGAVQDVASKVQVPDETNPLPARVAGAGLSALGTVAREATDQLDRLSGVSTAAREAAGEDVYGQKYAAAGGPRLEDEYRQLLNQRLAGDDSVNPRMTEIVGQLQQINDTIRAGRPQSEVNQALSAENPLTPVSTTLANLGAAVVAAPLVAGEAPLVARALAEILQPGTNPLELARALATVNDTHVSAPAIVDAIDQVRKMPGTAELAPVRAQVEQSSTDLLQAMIDAARAKGVDPEKLTAFEQQLAAMDPAAATRRALTPTAHATGFAAPAAGGVRGAIGNFLTGQESELGAVNPRVGATLGGAVAGGVAGNATTPEDAMTLPTPLGDVPIERGVRIATGAGIGAGLGSATAFRGPIEQSVLEHLRTAGLVAGPAAAAPVRGPIAQAVDLTKQSILSNPATHIANVIGNTIELARQPISLAMGGRGDDALAGLVSIGRGLPEAAGNAASALGGRQLAGLGQGLQSSIPGRAPIFRALSAADAFTRTLGEYQGMASEANRLLREAGMAPGDPGAAAYLASHATDLYREGTRAGAQSVFGRVASTGLGSGVLDSMFRTYSNAKEGLLNSPRVRDQAMGALMDFGIPFSGVPVQMLQIGLNRLPVAAQTTGAIRAVRALRAGNTGEAQRAIGETGLESAIQLMIGKNVADGNITGPDDPVHPNSVKVAGNWVSMNEWGAYALPMQIMASFADGYEKGGQDVPPGTPGATPLEQAANYYGPRFSAALNASLKPFQQGIPGENLIRLVSNIGQGGATAGALGLAQDAMNRAFVPGAARFVENLTDPVAREIDRKGVASLWQGTMANWPGLAQYLPSKIDPTTGEVLQKARTGAGILVGAQQEIASPITIEADRLKKQGYSGITPPTTYPDTVSYQGAQIKLNPTEKRAIAQSTGHILGDFAQRLNEPDYQQSTDNRKAQLMQAYINAADGARLRAWAQLVGPDVARERLIAAQRTVGRLNQQAPPPAFTAPSFLSSSSQSAQEQQGVGAGR